MQSTIVRRLRESGKRRLFLIPFLFTFANALFGLLSVLNTLEDKFLIAAYCIIGAALVDMLDGRIARALGVTSMIGMELDSLCDAVSFCLAPAILLYCSYFYTFNVLGPIAAGIYLCAGLFRLAKFNTTSCAQKHCFIGMSTPIAALLFALFTLNNTWLLASRWHYVVDAPLVMLLLVVGISFLMVSRVRFPTFKGGACNLLSRLAMVAIIIAAVVALWHGFPVLLTTLMVYILTALIYHLMLTLRGRRA